MEGSRTWNLFFYTRKGALGRGHKQAYGGYRTLQEPSDCFPFQSAHVLSADVLLQFLTLLEVISGLLKSHFCLDVTKPDYLTEIIRS